MSNPGDVDDTPIRSVQQLADYIAEGCKPKSEWRIGTEHEKFGFYHNTRLPPAYEPGGIRAVLDGMVDPNRWEPIEERGVPIGLKGLGTAKSASVSLEPAGQFELSGGTARTLHETKAEFDAHFAEVHRAADPLGLGFAPLGHHPTMRRDQMPIMPKARYGIMRRYMPLVGAFGLDMMTRTCTVQVNLDYASEEDMVRKLRVSLAFQPVATALFANSPFIEGKPSGFLSSRARVWTDTDNERSGMPSVMFEDGFGFGRYVDWLLDVPMYFVLRDGVYHDVAGQSFRTYMKSGLPDLPGVTATLGDFGDHMTTAFTDVRVKRFLEMRGADAGRPDMMLAQSAFWTGLLYDDSSLAAAEALITEHSWNDYLQLRGGVPALAMDAPIGKGTVRRLARDLVVIAADGLKSRSCIDEQGRDEQSYLDPIQAISAGEPTQAEYWLNKYHGDWAGDASRMLVEGAV